MASTRQHIPTEKIRERAYELWERNHWPSGLEMQVWPVAERDLRAELDEHGHTEPQSETSSSRSPSVSQ